jgi:hypothetical protein
LQFSARKSQIMAGDEEGISGENLPDRKFTVLSGMLTFHPISSILRKGVV